MRLIYILLTFFTLESVYAQNAAIFSGDGVKILKEKLKFKTEMHIEQGSVDPQAVATSGDTGSLYMRDNGVLYVKQDDGSSTNWNPLTSLPDESAAKDHFLTWNGTALEWVKPPIEKQALANGSFENGLTGWTTSGTCATIDAFATSSFMGDSARAVCNSAGHNATFTKDTTELTGTNGFRDNLAKYSCKIKSSGNSTITFRSRQNGATSKEFVYDVTGSFEWVTYEIIDTIGITSNGIEAVVEVDSSGTFYIDDCSISVMTDKSYQDAVNGAILTKDINGQKVWSDTISGSLNPVTNWVSHTSAPTFTGATCGGRHRFVGDTIEVVERCYINSAPSGTLSFSLPNSEVMDTSKFHVSGDNQVLGTVSGLDNGTAFNGGVVRFLSSTTVVANFKTATTYHYGSGGTTIPMTWAAGDVFSIKYAAPVVGKSSGTSALAQNQELLFGRYKQGSSQSVASGAFDVVELDTKVNGNIDDHFNTGTGTFTSPKDACYKIEGGGFTSAPADGTSVIYGIYVNSTGIAYQKDIIGTSAGTDLTVTGGKYCLSTNDTITLQFWHNNGANINVLNGESTFISIQEIPPTSVNVVNLKGYVQNSRGQASTDKMAVETCLILNSGTPIIGTGDLCNSWVSSLTDNAVGDTTFNLDADAFSADPACTCSIYGSSSSNHGCMIYSATQSAVRVLTEVRTTGADADIPVTINCLGKDN